MLAEVKQLGIGEEIAGKRVSALRRQHNDLFRLTHGQWPEKTVHDAEHGGVDANAQRQSYYNQAGVRRVLQELPERASQVLG